ncbi:chloramphenicol acetyltransferase [Flavobacterium hibernum]|uniref:Chloramphenicol acetyltransferase n=1 Tax=Flavobacterium hibernum TaxID=37752 RepID=A0A0D0EDH5_9FLAO|nr:chloramphenicol acetyltransferase [Flavobacterium hibernum]KIO50614.1 chloramphenicol acetyltransferase [Flavobacterium hibernum]OXA87481.1 chloramphenicol acetyltransferase [Flavobacterium hibernum]STO14350.1 Chloramphenicol acetyltransferase 3 [Flavobacterium hibernum]
MKTLLDLENWNRKEHFAHFCKMEEPFFGVTVEIDCTQAYKTAKELKTSFFIYYLHKTLVAVNAIENFKYRIADGKIYINNQIDASATIGREDGTFGFSLIEYNPDFKIFEQTALTEIERIQNTTGLFTRSFDNDNLIHFSAIPWLNFTSLSHARSYTFPDSCPKISFGKMITSEAGKKTISMSVHVHHGLMDGLHVGQFVDYFQEIMK